jgi:hypothetical protein
VAGSFMWRQGAHLRPAHGQVTAPPQPESKARATNPPEFPENQAIFLGEAQRVYRTLRNAPPGCSRLRQSDRNDALWGGAPLLRKSTQRSQCRAAHRALSWCHYGRRLRKATEPLATYAVARVEAVPKDGKHHRMSTEQKLTVFNRLEAHVGEDVRRSPAVPARSMNGFRLHARYAGRISAPARARSRAATPQIPRTETPPCGAPSDPGLPSARASGGTR